jgi:hypothetical protein
VPNSKNKEKRVHLLADEETEENASKAHQILHIVVSFQIYVILIKYCKKSNDFSVETIFV